MEYWKPIPEFEGLYEASNCGRIRSLDKEIIHKSSGNPWKRKGKILKLTQNSRGYLYVTLYQEKKPIHTTVHQLIMLAFVGRCGEGYVINHRDGNKTNNALENLEYATRRQDTLHSIHFLGHHKRGEKHPHARLTAKNVTEIRELYATGDYTQKELAEKYHIVQGHVNKIVNYKIWRHLN